MLPGGGAGPGTGPARTPSDSAWLTRTSGADFGAYFVFRTSSVLPSTARA